MGRYHLSRTWDFRPQKQEKIRSLFGLFSCWIRKLDGFFWWFWHQILDFTLKLLASFGVVVNCMTGHHTPLTYIPQKQWFKESLRETNGWWFPDHDVWLFLKPWVRFPLTGHSGSRTASTVFRLPWLGLINLWLHNYELFAFDTKIFILRAGNLGGPGCGVENQAEQRVHPIPSPINSSASDLG